ncbi:hypothetical protein [Pseudactinotalea sp. Z1732]|uniref:hypothetical protein n=1 Tax=Micrococcales TaxID=85006 RepID=UPI003C7AC43D
MVQDVIPWLLGPAGIVLGWWLNQRTLRGDAERQAREAEETAERQRVLQAVGLARDTAGLIRSLLHGIYVKAQYRRAPEGLSEMMDEFNRTKDRFRGAVLALRVLGPSWAVEKAERLDVEINKLSELGFVMQKGIKSEHMTTVNEQLPELDRMLRDYVSTVSTHYNDTASDLPPPPDMEKEGRWQSIEE